MGKVGEEREEEEKNPSRKIVGDCEKANVLLFMGPQEKESKTGSKNGKRPQN